MADSLTREGVRLGANPPTRFTEPGSTGTGLGATEYWTATGYYGSRGTFFADVTGDGKAAPFAPPGGTSRPATFEMERADLGAVWPVERSQSALFLGAARPRPRTSAPLDTSAVSVY